jgi:hypothetical protein
MHDTELKEMLLRLWINYPILSHGLLLYRESATTDATRKVTDEIRKDLTEIRKKTAEICGLPEDW